MDPSIMPWLYGSGVEPYGSMCGCGGQCRCPGCNETDFTSSAAFASCINPASCGACLNCSILTCQPPPSDTTVDYQGFDDWIRQLPSSTPFNASVDLAQIPKISEPTEKDATFVGSGDCSTVCGCPPGFCQCESDGKRCLSDLVSPMTLQMPLGRLLAVDDTLRSRSPSTSSDSSGFSSGHISTRSQRSSSSLPMSTSMPFPNTLDSGLHFWSS